jgi:hypothetical protein
MRPATSARPLASIIERIFPSTRARMASGLTMKKVRSVT